MNPLIVIYSLWDQRCHREWNGQIERERGRESGEKGDKPSPVAPVRKNKKKEAVLLINAAPLQQMWNCRVSLTGALNRYDT